MGDVLFADVDLLLGEEAVDFSVAPLPAADGLGTVGLWCALHGESILAAGMHHLEGQFDFDLAREQLTAAGIRQLAPFSSFDYLRQAFTDAERWPVDHAVLDSLVADGLLNSETAERFRAEGAAGSHLEVLQRGGGFKGFNQHNVSVTMRATDPRTYATVD